VIALLLVTLTPGPPHRLDAVIDAQFFALQQLIEIRQLDRIGPIVDEPTERESRSKRDVHAEIVAARKAKRPRRTTQSGALDKRGNWTPEAKAAHSQRMREHWAKRRAEEDAK